MKRLMIFLVILPLLAFAQSIDPEPIAIEEWGWQSEIFKSAVKEGVVEYEEVSKKIVAHKKEATMLALAILAGYLFFCFIATASNKIERLKIFNRLPIILINGAIVWAGTLFVLGDALIISKIVVAIFSGFSLLIIALAIFVRYWGAKTAFSVTLTMVLPANIMLGVITASWLAFLGSFVVLLIVSVLYFSLWGLIMRITKGKEIEEGGGDDE